METSIQKSEWCYSGFIVSHGVSGVKLVWVSAERVPRGIDEVFNEEASRIRNTPITPRTRCNGVQLSSAPLSPPNMKSGDGDLRVGVTGPLQGMVRFVDIHPRRREPARRVRVTMHRRRERAKERAISPFWISSWRKLL
jgi:hypothetical protein